MAKQKNIGLLIAVIGAGVIWYSRRPKKKKLQIITTKNRVFMVDNASDYYKIGLPRDETVKSMKWVPVG